MISVVMPLYNKERSVAASIDSVLAQNYNDFELIVVNDGSTDMSLNVVKNIRDNRLRIIDRKNGGVSSARNTGIMAARHEYIAFIDADDWWDPAHLQTLTELIYKFRCQAAVFATKFIKTNKGPKKTKKHLEESVFLVNNYFKNASRPEELLSSSSFATSKAALIAAGLYNENIQYGEDVDLWYRLLKTQKLAISTKITAHYRTEAENRSGENITPISKRFHRYDFDGAGYYEKLYLGKLLALIILDYSMKGDHKTPLSMIKRHKTELVYPLIYAARLLLKRLTRGLIS